MSATAVISSVHSDIYSFSDRIFHAMEDLKGGFSKDAHGFYLITLGTTGGAIQVMFEDQMQYRIWRSTICHLLCDC